MGLPYFRASARKTVLASKKRERPEIIIPTIGSPTLSNQLCQFSWATG